MRKRNRKVKLASRIGSRRNRLLLFSIFSLLIAAVWVSGVGNQNPGDQYLIATSDLTSFTQLSEATSTTVSVSLGDQKLKYIPADSKMASWFISKPVRAGELIPVSAVVPEMQSSCVAMKLNLGMSLNSGIHKGDLLDVWAADSSVSNGTIPVQILTASELLNSATATDALSQNVQTIELCVSPAEVRSVVNAIAQKQVVIAVLAR